VAAITGEQLAPVLLDTIALARAVDREPQTIRVWATAGLLTRRGRDTKGRTLYDLDEALAVAKLGAAGIRRLRAIRSTPVSSTTRVPRAPADR